jgi:hypothetical protein
LSPDYLDIVVPLLTRGTSQVSTSQHVVRDPNAEFKKEIKRDSSSFSVYTDEKQWDTWQHFTTLAQAQAWQDVAEILDRNYVPASTEDNHNFFLKKQKFV